MLLGTKYVWSAGTEFQLLYYARKTWAKGKVKKTDKSAGMYAEWLPPTPKLFGTWLYVLYTDEPNTQVRWTRKEWAQQVAYEKWDRRHYET